MWRRKEGKESREDPIERSINLWQDGAGREEPDERAERVPTISTKLLQKTAVQKQYQGKTGFPSGKTCKGGK